MPRSDVWARVMEAKVTRQANKIICNCMNSSDAILRKLQNTKRNILADVVVLAFSYVVILRINLANTG